MKGVVELADAFLAALKPKRTDHWGVVTAVGPPLVITIDGSAVPVSGVAKYASYAPAVNDRVAVEIVDGEPIVRGKV